jgi:hypothetical protein
MKTTLKKRAKPASISKELLKDLTNEQLRAVEDFVGKPVTEKRYSATLSMGGLVTTAQGNDESIFSGLVLPKVTYKCLLTVENNDNHNVMEFTLQPYMAKKLLTNPFVQKFQWKRITGKLA